MFKKGDVAHTGLDFVFLFEDHSSHWLAMNEDGKVCWVHKEDISPVIVAHKYDGKPMNTWQAYEVSKSTGAWVYSVYGTPGNEIRWNQDKDSWVDRDGDEVYIFNNNDDPSEIGAEYCWLVCEYEEPKKVLTGKEAKQALLEGRKIKNLRTNATYKIVTDWCNRPGRHLVEDDRQRIGDCYILTLFDCDDSWEIVTPAPKY